MSGLHTRLLAAHAADDRPALITLYAEAAKRALAKGRGEAGAFYLTHAYVFALEAADARADSLRARLVALGREHPS